MTYIEVLNRFNEEFPNAEVSDYRPVYEGFTKDRVGIMVWLSSGDMIAYFPKSAQGEENG